MTNHLKNGSDWLVDMMKTNATETIVYRHSGTDYSVKAVFGATKFETMDTDGTTVGTHAPDFLVLAADLGFEPEKGDRITANGRHYDVMPGSGERCWSWSDDYGKMYRIHTQDDGLA